MAERWRKKIRSVEIKLGSHELRTNWDLVGKGSLMDFFNLFILSFKMFF